MNLFQRSGMSNGSRTWQAGDDFVVQQARLLVEKRWLSAAASVRLAGKCASSEGIGPKAAVQSLPKCREGENDENAKLQVGGDSVGADFLSQLEDSRSGPCGPSRRHRGRRSSQRSQHAGGRRTRPFF